MLARSATTLLSVLATVAVVALGAAVPPALQSLDAPTLVANLSQHAEGQAAATTTASGQLIASEANGVHPAAASAFHARWVGQSEAASLSGGHVTTMRVSFRNTGTAAWVRGVLGQQANLGLSGEGAGLSSTWPRADRVAIQNESIVQPGGVATFSFDVRAPNAPGTYRLDLRPVIDGTTWMENEGVYVLVTSRGIEAPGTAIRPLLLPVTIAAAGIFLVMLLFFVLRLISAGGRSRLASAAGR